MRIGFYVADQNPHRDRTLGVTGYSDGLIRELQKSRDLELIALTSRSSYSPGSEIVSRRLRFRTDRSLTRALVDNLHPLFARSDVDLWHYPKGHLPLLGRFRRPVVGTVHDVILQHYADHYPHARSRAAYGYWLTVLKRSIARFDRILTVSEFSRRAIMIFCERHQIKAPPIDVTYEGFAFHEGAESPGEKKDIVLHLASMELHKRTSTLLKFWKELTELRGDLPRLQLIGNLSSGDRKVAATIPGVQIRGRVTAAILRQEMAAARAVLLPSEIEGFGLPALEAYAAGTPVVYVRETAVEEILGAGTAGGFLLHDFDSFRRAVQQALDLSTESVAEKAKHLREQFSWVAVAKATVTAYSESLSCSRATDERRKEG